MVWVATPLALRVAVPNTFPPFLKVTVPTGVPPAEVTCTVKVTLWCHDDGFTEDVTVEVVAALCTTCESAGEVLLA